MLRFRVALLAYSTRLLLPIALVVLAVVGAVYLGAIPLNDPNAARSPICSSHLLIFCPDVHPSRFGWQIPVAVLIGVAGLGSAAALARWNRRNPPTRPLPPLPAGWQ